MIILSKINKKVYYRGQVQLFLNFIYKEIPKRKFKKVLL
jgi:hypothetical protein